MCRRSMLFQSEANPEPAAKPKRLGAVGSVRQKLALIKKGSKRKETTDPGPMELPGEADRKACKGHVAESFSLRLPQRLPTIILGIVVLKE